MKSTTRSMNQSEGLKVNKKVNHLLPPYNQTTQQEQQQYEKSRQLSILPILQPTPSQLLNQRVEEHKQSVRPKPTSKPLSRTNTKENSRKVNLGGVQLQLPRDKKKLEEMKQEQIDWLNSLPDKL